MLFTINIHPDWVCIPMHKFFLLLLLCKIFFQSPSPLPSVKNWWVYPVYCAIFHKLIDPIRILTVRLDLAWNGGSCEGNNLHRKRFPCISLSFMLVSSATMRVRYGLFSASTSDRATSGSTLYICATIWGFRPLFFVSLFNVALDVSENMKDDRKNKSPLRGHVLRGN